LSWQPDAASPTSAASLHIEQVGATFLFPVTATVRYADGTMEDVPIVVRDRTTDIRLPLRGPARDILLNRDGLTPLDVLTGR
jgi:hypothetical protein